MTSAWGGGGAAHAAHACRRAARPPLPRTAAHPLAGRYATVPTPTPTPKPPTTRSADELGTECASYLRAYEEQHSWEQLEEDEQGRLRGVVRGVARDVGRGAGGWGGWG